MTEISNPPPELVAHVTNAADALLRLCAAREKADPGFSEFADRRRNLATDQLISMARRVRRTPTERVRANFLAAKRLAEQVLATFDAELLRVALGQIFFAAEKLVHSQELRLTQRAAAAVIAMEVSSRTKCPAKQRDAVREFLGAQQDTDREPPDFEGVLAGMTQEDLRDLLLTVARGLQSRDFPVRTWEELQDERAAVDLLADAARRQASEAGEAADHVSYDLSESSLRLCAIELSGFRGSPKRVTLKVEQGGSPRSAILFGENGVGKSTVVDAVEFALQGKIGRSSNFESPVGSAVRSYAGNANPEVTAVLSDGRRVERSVQMAEKGYLVASPVTVSSGFRIAPITLNRNDILRFLDTDAMERGSLLLDYFPAEAGRLASRPQDALHRLAAEQAELRIRRTRAAAQLAPLLGCSPLLLAGPTDFMRVVRKELMGGRTWKEFEEQGGWKEVDRRTAQATKRLAGIFNQLTVAKKRVEAARDVLNPVAHADQVRILRPILADVGTELSHAFVQIARGYPVERIDVVFAESGPLSLDVVVQLSNGRNCFPQQIFSEAYKDLIALLFFTSVAKKASERGQAKILILDDVLQSVDAAVRHAFMTYVLETFGDWQLIVTAHDRLWRDQLRDLFLAHDHVVVLPEIRDWDFDAGPVFVAPEIDRVRKDLELMMKVGEPRSIAAAAGQLLELASDKVSLSMKLEVPRQEKYTLGDLFPVVRARLAGTAAEEAARKVASHQLLRNLTVHADSRSWTLNLVDARAFGQAVLDLVGHVRCASCGWLPKVGVCRCGAVRL